MMKLGFVVLICTLMGSVARADTIRRTALAGDTIKMDFFVSLNPDCSPTGPQTVRVTQNPSNGHLKVSKAEDFITFPATNVRSACNTRRVPGMRIEYTPQPGYSGSDYMAIEVITANGFERNRSYYVTVK